MSFEWVLRGSHKFKFPDADNFNRRDFQLVSKCCKFSMIYETRKLKLLHNKRIDSLFFSMEKSKKLI